MYTSSGVGNRSRQTFVAAARSGKARPNDSITSQPSYLTFFSARNVSSQATWPVPGVPRSFSLTWK